MLTSSDELERRIEERDADTTRQAREDADDSTPNLGSNTDSTAHDILALLARELPKLVHQGRNQSGAIPASSERSYKRRRQHHGDHITSQLDDAPSPPGSDTLEPILIAYFAYIHPWIPMIHQGRFFQKLADEAGRKQLLIILHSMVLAASKFVPGAAMPVRACVRSWIIGMAMENFALENLQALIILAFNDFGDGNTERAWSVIGSMTRTVEYLQLAQEQEESEQRPFSRPYAPLRSTGDWTEVEERRRVFWNVFLLDRLCSVTTGWNTSLTSDDVHRRLPCDGHFWRKQEPVLTPYLGIWDKSEGRIGKPIDYMSRHPSPGHANSSVDFSSSIHKASLAKSHSQHHMPDMSTVGALAYNIEATESMSRVMSYFLQQKVNVHDQNDINSWLTRFKELDLRLVHWKMLLPQKWRTNPNLTRHVPFMDPNLTTAHVTHNTSMIILHQTVAYPPLHWDFRNRLPSNCSAEACYSAGVEIATITQKYLGKSLNESPVGSQYAFCVFIAARVLLVHWRYKPGQQLPPEFWSLVQSLDEMSARWNCSTGSSPGLHNLFAKYALRLRELYDVCTANATYQINAMDYTSDIHAPRVQIDSASGYQSWMMTTQGGIQMGPEINTTLSSNRPEIADYNTVPQIILDQDFVDLDRVIAFDDGSMFTATFDGTTAAW
ncbi:hypothetical protein EKO04_008010 [Ascochyta lentis]|uniref:Xylanolytic transcriptional activator regulatory domain-containing protein n=1 Tax=Ascochyta lentis TaxID=205686 RepID=A0A8H7J0F9_9PLEO|nr:hypothetical protein EKO04_008010 [Ascochyta lentis]